MIFFSNPKSDKNLKTLCNKIFGRDALRVDPHVEQVFCDPRMPVSWWNPLRHKGVKKKAQVNYSILVINKAFWKLFQKYILS